VLIKIRLKKRHIGCFGIIPEIIIIMAQSRVVVALPKSQIPWIHVDLAELRLVQSRLQSKDSYTCRDDNDGSDRDESSDSSSDDQYDEEVGRLVMVLKVLFEGGW
jgi:hypothetical protein